VAAFAAVLGEWLSERGLKRGQGLAVDGKTRRGIHGEEIAGVHLISAFAHHSGIVPAPRAATGQGRELAVSSDLNEWAHWPGLAQGARLTSLRQHKGKTTLETSSLITSLSPERATPAQLLALVRGHRGLENRLQWVREVTFDQDRCQIRTSAVPQVMAALRNLVIGLLRLCQSRNIAAALRALAGTPRRALTLVTTPQGITQ
jgi:predicted transposase YbfD/YdcC